jgi:hypothetical protein
MVNQNLKIKIVDVCLWIFFVKLKVSFEISNRFNAQKLVVHYDYSLYYRQLDEKKKKQHETAWTIIAKPWYTLPCGKRPTNSEKGTENVVLPQTLVY